MSVIIEPIGEREFNVYGLSLPRGPNFETHVFLAAWKSQRANAVGAVLVDRTGTNFRALAMRRRVDHRLTLTYDADIFSAQDEAAAAVVSAMRPEDPPEALPPGAKRRAELFIVGNKPITDLFKILTGTVSHVPALMTIGETYLALPRPDDNFVAEFQSGNLDSRLWELYLLACFREQGLTVTQDYPSPDFLIEGYGYSCWVEAVTANPDGDKIQGYAPPIHAPENREERLTGAPAERFAKTLRSKLQRQYEKRPHVSGQPLALAIADFHAQSSMVWSREALPCYLYGVHPQVIDDEDGRRVIGPSISVLRGKHQIPAGLFRDPNMAHLSAVIFSNAATFSKFNRMGFLAGWRPPELTMIREGILFDRTPGAIEPVPFKLDVLSDEYASLWPGGEAWCQEMDVFHNPLANNPISFDLLPGATHWFERDGEVECSTIWESSVLSSMTHLQFRKSEGISQKSDGAR